MRLKDWIELEQMWDTAPCRVRVVVGVAEVERLAWTERLTDSQMSSIVAWAFGKWGSEARLVWEGTEMDS